MEGGAGEDWSEERQRYTGLVREVQLERQRQTLRDTGQVREALLERHNLSSTLDRQVERYTAG